MTAEAGTDLSPPSTTIKSLEQRYIALLEEKIAQLEKQLSAKATLDAPKSEAIEEKGVKDTNSVATSTDKVEAGKEKTADKASPPEQPAVKKNPRIRWIARRYNADGELEDLPDEEEPLKAELNKDEPQSNYAITWRRVYHYSFGDSSNTNIRKPYNKELLIESAALRIALTEVAADDYASMSFDTKEVVIPYPYACIYHSRAKLEQYAKSARADVREDIEILISEVFAEIESEVNDAKRLGEKKVITFDLLWTLFRPRGLVFATPIMNQPQAFLVNAVSTPDLDMAKQEQRFLLWVYSMDYTGKEFNRLDIKLEIKYFEGAKPICGLQVYPLEWYEEGDGETTDIEKLKERLIQRGRRFEELCNAKRGKQMFVYHGQVIDEGQDYLLSGNPSEDDASSYRTHQGKVPSLSSYARKEELPPGSQVMVDFEAFFQHGGKTVSIGALEVTRSTECWCSACTRWAREYDGVYPGNKKASKKALTEDQLLICPPRVLGFALIQKSWVQLLVDHLSPPKKEEHPRAFDLLELEEKKKQLIKALVAQHTKNNGRVNDLIPGKGNGLIVLLHGPPGVGKTLTAESVALLTGKPLYSISMSDIGLSSSIAETNLIRIFDLAVRWEAILLFDEADVFLESRSLSNIQRNGLVSMLLRVLEYYHGILFLTTNRVKTFDEAFQSRCHIAIKYEMLTHAQRRKIWLMWLRQLSPELAKIEDETVEEEIEELSSENFNGRQIRNIVASAQALARSKSKYGNTTFADIVKVVKVTKEFQVYLNQSDELAKMQMLR